MSERVVTQLREIMRAAVEERRGLVVYARLEPVEMDRLARRVERETLEKVRRVLMEDPGDEHVMGLRNRLKRMDDELSALGDLGGIQEASRQMQTDEIVWQAFEDIASLLGVQ
jgi:hypothetical protein